MDSDHPQTHPVTSASASAGSSSRSQNPEYECPVVPFAEHLPISASSSSASSAALRLHRNTASALASLLAVPSAASLFSRSAAPNVRQAHPSGISSMSLPSAVHGSHPEFMMSHDVYAGHTDHTSQMVLPTFSRPSLEEAKLLAFGNFLRNFRSFFLRREEYRYESRRLYFQSKKADRRDMMQQQSSQRRQQHSARPTRDDSSGGEDEDKGDGEDGGNNNNNNNNDNDDGDGDDDDDDDDDAAHADDGDGDGDGDVREDSNMPKTQFFMPPFTPCPAGFEQFFVPMTAWTSSLDMTFEELAHYAQMLQNELASGNMKVRCIQRRPIFAMLLPAEYAQRFRDFDSACSGGGWCADHGKMGQKSTVFSCSRARVSRTKNANGPARANRVTVRTAVDENGILRAEDPCPFNATCRYVDNKFVLVMFFRNHHHVYDDEGLFRRAMDLHPHLVEFVKDHVIRGYHESSVHVDLWMSVLRKFLQEKRKPSFVDSALFPSSATISNMVKHIRKGHPRVRIPIEDLQDMHQLVREYPVSLKLLEPFVYEHGELIRHFILHVGDGICINNYLTFCKGNLLLLDGTQNGLDVGYRVYSAFGIDSKTGRPQICGHLFTSDFSNVALRKWLKYLCRDGLPLEAVVHCDPTQEDFFREGLDNVGFPVSAVCFFSTIRSLIDSLPEFRRAQRSVGKALIRQLYLADSRERFNQVMGHLSRFFQNMEETTAYWNIHYSRPLEAWWSLRSRYPSLPIIQCLDVCHRRAQYTGEGKHRMFLYRLGDVLRSLAGADVSEYLEVCVHVKEGGHKNGSGKIQLTNLLKYGEENVEALLSCRHETFDACNCRCKVLSEDAGSQMFTYFANEDSFDVNMRAFKCSCTLFEERPHLPCKHVVAISMLLETEAGKNAIWQIVPGCRSPDFVGKEHQQLQALFRAFDYDERENSKMSLLLHVRSYFRNRMIPDLDINLDDLGYKAGTLTDEAVREDDSASNPRASAVHPSEVPQPRKSWNIGVPGSHAGPPPSSVSGGAIVNGGLRTSVTLQLRFLLQSVESVGDDELQNMHDVLTAFVSDPVEGGRNPGKRRRIDTTADIHESPASISDGSAMSHLSAVTSNVSASSILATPSATTLYISSNSSTTFPNGGPSFANSSAFSQPTFVPLFGGASNLHNQQQTSFLQPPPHHASLIIAPDMRLHVLGSSTGLSSATPSVDAGHLPSATPSMQ
eukprot:ANDGO_00873.mRNA.1 hypothetical protein